QAECDGPRTSAVDREGHDSSIHGSFTATDRVPRLRRFPLLNPPIPEGFQSRKRLAVLHPARRFLAANDVIDMANAHAFDRERPAFRLAEGLYPVRCEDKIEVER